jgi:transposase
MSTKTTGGAAPNSPASESEIAHDVMAGAVNALGARAGITYPEDTPEPEKRKSKPDDDDDDPQAGADDDDSDSGSDQDAGDGDQAGDDDDDPESDEGQPKPKDGADDDDDDQEAGDGDDDEPANDDDDEPAAGEDDDAKALSAEHAQLVNAKLKDLPKEIRGRVQSILDGRIGGILKKHTSEKAQLEEQVSGLSAELEEAKSSRGGAVIVPGVHPLFTADNEAVIEQRIEAIEAFEDWADKYKDGYEGDGTDKDPSYTADQIRARLREVRRERDRVVPAARANLAKRRELDAKVREFYPQLFDPKSPDYLARQRILKTMPELRRFADASVLVLQQVLGERALTELLQKRKAPDKDKGGRKGSDEQPPRRKAPRAPGSGGAAKGSVVVHRKEAPATSEAVKKFTETRTRASLVDAVGAITGL